MSAIRLASVLVSTALHGALALAFVDFQAGPQSLEAGTGNDLLRIEQGIAIDGVARLGEAPETIEAREVETTESSVATPEMEEVKAVEQVPPEPPREVAALEPPPPDALRTEKPNEIEDVIASPLGETREILTAPLLPPPKEVTPEPLEEVKEQPPPDIKPPQPKLVAMEQQVEQVAVIEQQAASQSMSGGDATLYTAYLGSIRTHVERHKVKPKSLGRGTTVVRFTISRTGEITSREVATSSGSAELDQAALAAIDKASPFPKFPDKMSRDQIVLSIPFRFITR
ncbi:MAG: energy transducer TonB [Hyphomicrobiaceae bacterium]|nr:energy transducer TonB [Hyphomicrobiaceae bacterium]